MTLIRSCHGLSLVERAVVDCAKVLIRLALVIASWRFRSASRATQHTGAMALSMIGFMATGLGLILHAIHRLARLLSPLDPQPSERGVFEIDSLGSDVTPWRVERRSREAA